MCASDSLKFIVDINAGKLAKWLRLIGYDTLLFDHRDDNRLVHIAATENRALITRDTQIMKRRIITTGELKALLILSDNPGQQIHEAIEAFGLKPDFNPFSRCLECNDLLIKIDKEATKDRVPPYVFQTQSEYVECPNCRRVYWQGTHWTAISKQLEKLSNSRP